MPYIPQDKRDNIDYPLRQVKVHINNVGELNYAVTRLLLNYVQEKAVSYGLLNEVYGVLGCVAAEFYHRVVSPYEISKLELNGDVYE
jgi:hypothetical protein